MNNRVKIENMDLRNKKMKVVKVILFAIAFLGMANVHGQNIVVDSKMRRVTYDELMKPLLEYKAAQDAKEQLFNDYCEKAYEAWENDEPRKFLSYSNMALRTGLYTASLYYDRGRVYEELKEEESAREEYRKAVQKGSTQASAALNRMDKERKFQTALQNGYATATKQRDFVSAAAYYDEAIAIGSSNSEMLAIVYALRGDLFLRSDSTSMAIKYYSKALEIGLPTEFRLSTEREMKVARSVEYALAKNKELSVYWERHDKNGYLACSSELLSNIPEEMEKVNPTISATLAICRVYRYAILKSMGKIAESKVEYEKAAKFPKFNHPDCLITVMKAEETPWLGSLLYIEPKFSTCEDSNLKVRRVSIQNDRTAITFGVSTTAGGSSISIDKNAYIIAGGKKYVLQRAENIAITPGQTKIAPNETRTWFRLIFPPIPRTTKTIDFIESNSSSWKVRGIQLNKTP